MENKKLPAAQPPQTVTDSFMSALLDPSISPERLEKMMDLKDRWDNRQASMEFSAAMAGFQGDCPVIKKTKKVKFTSGSGKTTEYNYSPIDEIAEIIRPILKKHGLSYSFNIETKESGLAVIVTTIRHSSGHSEQTRYEFNDMHDDMRMNLSQRRKSAVTFAKRAALENALGIVTAEEDDDARRAVDRAITPAQIDEIDSLLAMTITNKSQFLAVMKVEKVEHLSEFEAARAISLLKQKRSRASKEVKNV